MKNTNNEIQRLFGYKCRVVWGKNSFPLLEIYLREDKVKIHHDVIDKIIDYLSKEGFLNESTGEKMFAQLSYCVCTSDGTGLGSKGIIQLKTDSDGEICWESEFTTYEK